MLKQINIQVGFNNDEKIMQIIDINTEGSINDSLNFGKAIIKNMKNKTQIIRSIIWTKQDVIIFSDKFDLSNIFFAVLLIFVV